MHDRSELIFVESAQKIGRDRAMTISGGHRPDGGLSRWIAAPPPDFDVTIVSNDVKGVRINPEHE